jgi:phosphocarrier protein HPr
MDITYHYNNSRPDNRKNFEIYRTGFIIYKDWSRDHMKEFEYVIKGAVGIHARPASLLAKEASGYKSSIMLCKNEERVDAKKLLSIMSLGVKCSEKVRFIIEGEDEEPAADQLKIFCEQNL